MRLNQTDEMRHLAASGAACGNERDRCQSGDGGCSATPVVFLYRFLSGPGTTSIFQSRPSNVEVLRHGKTESPQSGQNGSVGRKCDVLLVSRYLDTPSLPPSDPAGVLDTAEGAAASGDDATADADHPGLMRLATRWVRAKDVGRSTPRVRTALLPTDRLVPVSKPTTRRLARKIRWCGFASLDPPRTVGRRRSRRRATALPGVPARRDRWRLRRSATDDSCCSLMIAQRIPVAPPRSTVIAAHVRSAAR